ncbi:thiaminase/transcriptional activator TenA [Kineococcus xinjiangensis]|uniref:Thiaminase/transcriptional activator TenA n=1 Tax=Kineococcus xinjiangensis TaxID=512762 RepID=A0A2S6ICY6_9ACTN|nr:TenA family protein [Kineococcus xinjiangensis]PPK92082.1 thiaminase/transcriptional activator TenA [Kineococcus xinjiangensis]
MGGRFTDELWEATADLRAAIDDLEFLTQLGEGSLAPEAFRQYLEQDALYLAGYGKALAMLAVRAPETEAVAFWAGSARTTTVVEAALHEDLLTGGGLPPATSETPEHSPACLAYVSYLIAAAATEPYPVAAAAILPCYWVYAEVGSRLARTAKDVLAANRDHPYARWVATYDAEEFQEAVRTARDLVDAAALDASPKERAAMRRAFAIATRYELLFWKSAFDLEAWDHPLEGIDVHHPV